MALTPKMVTIDCVNPQELARFWIEAAGYTGAKILGEESVPGLSWTVLADPEDNEFCVEG